MTGNTVRAHAKKKHNHKCVLLKSFVCFLCKLEITLHSCQKRRNTIKRQAQAQKEKNPLYPVCTLDSVDVDLYIFFKQDMDMRRQCQGWR